MDWTTIAPAVFSLVGVAVGTLGSVGVAYATTRTTKEQARLQRSSALRAERKEILLEYLREMQNFHDFAASSWERPPTAETLDEYRKERATRDS